MYDIFGKYGAIRQIRVYVFILIAFYTFMYFFNTVKKSLRLMNFFAIGVILPKLEEQLLLFTRIYLMQRMLVII